ncbi:MAG: PDZ domain-containing protein [Acidimicrobiia bacterium]
MREPTSTSDDPPAPAGPPPRNERSRRRRIAATVGWTVGALLLVVVLAGFFVHLPYVIISPGSATPLDQSVVTIEGAPTYGSAGNLLYLTVRVSGSDPNVWKYLTASIDPDQQVVKREAVVGCLSDADNVRYNADLMSQSQDDATKVALERLGYTVTASAPRLTVIEACRGVPAAGALQVGDEIVAIDGKSVTDGAALAAAVRTFEPGHPIPVTVVRDGETRTVDVPTGEFVPDKRAGSGARCAAPGVKGGTGEPCFGILLQSFVDYQFPIDVKFDLARIGGPSAGLAFTLAIIDDLTPGDLTGGARVAVTGTIAPDGTVGPVGGVEQKAITARHQGVDLMIVPRAELKDARAGAGDVRVVPVDSLDGALAALQRHGGAAVPPPTTTAARS